MENILTGVRPNSPKLITMNTSEYIPYFARMTYQHSLFCPTVAGDLLCKSMFLQAAISCLGKVHLPGVFVTMVTLI